MKNILWLPAWYPNQTEPLSGDFIQRHARAVSLYHSVNLIFVVRDKEGKITKDIHEENFYSGNLHETIIYYYSPKHFSWLLEKLLSEFKFRRIYKQAVRKYMRAYKKPDIIHVHVADKNGAIALWVKRKYKIPFVLTEHWTIYLPDAKPNFTNTSLFFKLLWKRIIKNASKISVVSEYLGNAIKQINNEISFSIIPNVIDTNIFFSRENAITEYVHFIHVSNLNYQKNAEAIFHAFAIVKKTFPTFRVSVFGPEKNELKRIIAELNLSENIFFYGEVPQPELATFMQKADALVLYSRYETFGCVIIEANACGLPVIVSDIPVFHEIIKEGENGVFAIGENSNELSKKITWFIHNRSKFSKGYIAGVAKEKYSFEKVGRLFADFYNEALKD
ncbi:MAG: glycosyltransferase [Bacteroidetes bacterium]|nr:glycosyltransferase [Bacteroidota bacterium]